MIPFSDFAVRAAEWLAPPPASESPAASPPRQVVISFEKDGSLRLEARGWDPSLPEPAELRAAALRWDLSGRGESLVLHVVADPVRVSGRPDEPETLFALHALAARRTDARVILKLPPDQFGRRW